MRIFGIQPNLKKERDIKLTLKGTIVTLAILIVVVVLLSISIVIALSIIGRLTG